MNRGPWLELFSISEEFFGDRRKRSLIYRVLTAKNMRPQKVTWLGRKGDLVRFFDHFSSNHHIEKNGRGWQNSDINFLECYNIEHQKSPTSEYANVRYYAGNDLKQTSFLLELTSTITKWTMMKNMRFFVFFRLFLLKK